MRRPVVTCAAAFAVLVISAMLSGHTAAADEGPYDDYWKTTDENHGGWIWWDAPGDNVEICDMVADGRRVIGEVYNHEFDNSLRYRIKAVPKGDCTDREASDGGAFNLVEGVTYWIRVCRHSQATGKTNCKGKLKTA